MKGTDESLVWHLRRALLWIPSLATLALLPQSCSSPQAHHYSPSCPSIGDIVTHPQNGMFSPFCRGHPKDNTHLSRWVTLLERLRFIWLEASSEFSSITEKNRFVNFNISKCKRSQTKNKSDKQCFEKQCTEKRFPWCYLINHKATKRIKASC